MAAAVKGAGFSQTVFRYIRQPRNLGGAANFNLLAQLSERPYFKWAAHDDLLAPGFLAACVEVLDREPMVVLASPAFQSISTRPAHLFPIHLSAVA